MGNTSTAAETTDCPCRSPHGETEHDCPTCDGTGTIDTDALTPDSFAPDESDPGWHWHEGQLGADQFCMACDAVAAQSWRASITSSLDAWSRLASRARERFADLVERRRKATARATEAK